MNNRELASLIILATLVIFGLTRVDVRSSIGNLLKAATSWKILVPFVVYLLFIAGCVWVFSTIELWNREMLAETAIWVMATGFPLLLTMPDSDGSPGFFRKQIRSVFEFGTIFIFFVNIATFSLPWEIALQLFLLLLVGIRAVAATDPQYHQVRRALPYVWTSLVVILVIFTIVELISHFHDLDRTQIGLSFLASLWLPIGTIVFLLFFSIVASYEKAFQKFSMVRDSQKPSLTDKLALLSVVGPRLAILGAFKPYWGKKIMNQNSIKEKRKVAIEFLKERKERIEADGEAERRLVEYAGSSGDDTDGRRLDRREFAETIEAMQWIYTCQLGHYRKRNGTYEPELLAILGTFSGLPDVHGISLEVREDGQAWFAWRKTVTGWVFGIGAGAPPTDKWYFDGPEAPTSCPSADGGWDHWTPGTNARYWI